jgi:3-hydroxybutyryl-CoA dehydrogenase
MGSGIAEVCARADLDVTVVEGTSAAMAAGVQRLEASLLKAQAAGKIASASQILGRVTFSDDLVALADRNLVIEAIAEDEKAKVDLFRSLDEVILSPDAILATNTSSIPIMKLAVATSRPENVVGIHFFNPVPVLELVELVPSLLTSTETLDRARRFAAGSLGKHVIDSQDRAGFVVNALLIPFLLSAIRMVESGFATVEHIDQGLVKGCAHPQGPLALTDLIGLDTTKAVAESLYEEFKEPLFAPPPLLLRMVDAGLLGRKSGRGFHTY